MAPTGAPVAGRPRWNKPVRSRGARGLNEKRFYGRGRLASCAWVAKPGQRRGTQDPFPKGFPGSNPGPRIELAPSCGRVQNSLISSKGCVGRVELHVWRWIRDEPEHHWWPRIARLLYERAERIAGAKGPCVALKILPHHVFIEVTDIRRAIRF